LYAPNGIVRCEAMQLDSECLDCLRNPPQESIDISNLDLHLTLNIYLVVGNASQETYNAVQTVILCCYPENKLLSYDQIKRRVMQMSGVTSLIHDMCINGCLVFMGPFAGLEACLTCSEPQYEQVTLTNSGRWIKKAHQEFHTMPIGPQLQALWCHPESAAHAKYLDAHTHEIIEELKHNDRLLDSYDDFLHGAEFLQAVESGRIKPGNMVFMFSMDGTQLYHNKQLDCWIGIWVIFYYSPDFCYKKDIVMLVFVIPGPNKLKNSDSYLFPSLHHLVALQIEGLPIWDSASNSTFILKPFLTLATADGPSMVNYINRFVGYHGKHGC
jgi:hypothetical protein